MEDKKKSKLDEIVEKENNLDAIAKFTGHHVPLIDGLPPRGDYHNSWDWLMSAVEIIEKTTTEKHVHFFLGNSNNSAGFIGVLNKEAQAKNDGRAWVEVVSTNGKGRFEATYNAVLEFVKWYNENK